MPSFSGQFQLLARGRGAVRSGACQFQFDDTTATIVADGPPLAFDLGDIDAYSAGDYEIRLSLFDGQDLVLTRFAKAFQDLERQLREAYRDRTVQCLLVSDLDEVARFTGVAHLESPTRACDGSAEIRLYESNLAVLPDGAGGFQWRLADIDSLAFDEANYAVVLTQGGERLRIGKLAKRTGELADRLRSRIAALKERSARALHGVFPFLGPQPFSDLADAMREGGSAAISTIGPLHPLVEPVLLEGVVEPDRQPYLRALAGRASGAWFSGFKIIRREGAEDEGGDADAEAVEAAAAEEVTTDGADAAAPAEAAAPRDLSMLDVGDGLEVLFWFFFPLGRGGRPTHVAWEATSRGGRATYVFRLDPGQPVAASVASLNRGLVALNFRREPIYLDAKTLESSVRYRHYVIAQRKLADLRRVRESFAGRAIHTTPSGWARKLDDLLAR